MTLPKPSPPEQFRNHHEAESFDSGEPVMDEWLKTRALRNEELRVSRTYVTCSENTVVGYYALAVGSLHHEAVSSRVRRNMPDPIPIVVLARLAVDRRYQGIGLGQDLVRHAFTKCVGISELAGARAVVVHVLSQSLKPWYQRLGFQEVRADSFTMLLPIDQIVVASDHPWPGV